MKSYTEKELEQLISYHDKRYWTEGEPEISDQEYDLLLRRLEELNPGNPLLSRVHAPSVAGDGKVRHAEPMLSLAKAYSLDELISWASKIARGENELFLVQPKYDGISARFANGVLATRGDGVEGENISSKIPLVELESPGYKGPVDRPVRGEIVIRNDDFREIYPNIRKKDGGTYKNSRNAVAGIMGLKEIDGMLRQGAKLTLVDYDLVSYSVAFSELRGKWQALQEEIQSLPYPLDGIVVKLADAAYAASLGSTAHHPRSQIAFKFTGVRKKTKLLDIRWSFGKNCITPVAVLEPVELGGITINHATLHNIQNILDRGIMIGDTVTVERAGDVIPYILDSEPGEERRSGLIVECPSCGTELRRAGPEICCPNNECPETKLQRLLASVKSIGIERLGEPNIRKMMKVLGVRDLKDIFALSRQDILRLDGFKDKSADNLVAEIARAREVNDYDVLASLNIRAIGRNLARKILESFTLGELRTLSEEKLAEIDGVGPERASALFCELRRQSEYLDELIEALSIKVSKGVSSLAKEAKICFSGKMPRPRSYYEGIARSRGFLPVDSVASDTAILVLEDLSSSSSKAQKASKLGVKIIQLDEWLSGAGGEKPAVAEDKELPASLSVESVGAGASAEVEQMDFGF